MGQAFRKGQFPCQFESCDWSWGHRGPEPPLGRNVKHAACHWLVNFTQRLAQLAEPGGPWRIVSCQKHSTVWYGEETLFDFNFLALGIDADECFALADEKRLPPGKRLRVNMAPHFRDPDGRAT